MHTFISSESHSKHLHGIGIANPSQTSTAVTRTPVLKLHLHSSGESTASCFRPGRTRRTGSERETEIETERDSEYERKSLTREGRMANSQSESSSCCSLMLEYNASVVVFSALVHAANGVVVTDRGRRSPHFLVTFTKRVYSPPEQCLLPVLPITSTSMHTLDFNTAVIHTKRSRPNMRTTCQCSRDNTRHR